MTSLECIDVRVSEALKMGLDDFIDRHSGATAYAMASWMEAIGRYMAVFPRYLVARAGDAVVGVLPLATRPMFTSAPMRCFQTSRAESLGSACFGGPLVSEQLPEDDRLSVLRCLVTKALSGGVGLVRLTIPAWTDQGWLRDGMRGLGFISMGSGEIAVKQLGGLSTDQLLKSYHSSHRRCVEAASRRGVVVRAANTQAEHMLFADMVSETMERNSQDARFPLGMIDGAGRGLVAAGRGRLYLAHLRDRPVAGAFMLHSRSSSCYWLGATVGDRDSLNSRPMHAIFHQAFVDALDRGCRSFELGGMPTEGLRDFKMRWGSAVYQQDSLEWSPLNLVDRLRKLRGRGRVGVGQQEAR